MARPSKAANRAELLTLREQREDLTLELHALTAERAEAALAQKVLLHHYRAAVRQGGSPARLLDALERIVDRELARVQVAVPLRDQQMVLGLPLPLHILPGGGRAPAPIAPVVAQRQERVA